MTDYDVGSERRLSAEHVGLLHPDSVRPARMSLTQRFGQIGIECGLSGLGMVFFGASCKTAEASGFSA